MKGFISFILIVVLVGTLVAGGVASFFAYNSLNEKDYATLAKDGRIYVDEVVPAEDQNEYVRISKDELIRATEQMRRVIKRYEKRLDKAKSDYNNTRDDANAQAVRQAEQVLNTHKEAYKDFRQGIAQSILATFFSIYMPIMVFAAIGLVLTARIERRHRD